MSLTLNEKIVQIMTEVHAIGKNGYNDRQKYKYVEAVDVIREVRALMIEYKLRLKSEVIERNREDKITVLTIKYTLIDIENNETDTTTVITEGMDGGDKGAAKAMTMGLKYYLRDTFMLEFADDPERDDKTKPTKDRKRKQPTKPTTQTEPTQPQPKAHKDTIQTIRKKWRIHSTFDKLDQYVAQQYKKTLIQLNAAEAAAIMTKLNKKLSSTDMTAKQRGQIFGKGKKRGLTNEQAKRVAYKYCRVDSLTKLTALKAYDVCELIDSMEDDELKQYAQAEPSKAQLLEGIKDGINGLSKIAAMGGTA